jgi:hypothetical protein
VTSSYSTLLKDVDDAHVSSADVPRDLQRERSALGSRWRLEGAIAVVDVGTPTSELARLASS